jgi:hypothetical protein
MNERSRAYADNRLAYVDQAMFLSLRAAGEEPVAQLVSVYEHPVDFDGLRRLARNLDQGLLRRRVERSPLPFGRHRWVQPDGPSPEIDIADRPRPRSELSDWADERAQLYLDPEWGPGWHMGVQSFTDGSTAVSTVISHCLVDGFGAFATVVDAAKGNVRDFGYPPARSRSRRHAIAADLRETWQDAPEIAKALRSAVKLLAQKRSEQAKPATSRRIAIPGGGEGGNVVVPAIQIYVNSDDWNARATALGGTSQALLVGLAAKLGERTGRRRTQDGTVKVLLPISDRTPDDTRANAAILTSVNVDPAPVTTDLSGTRAMLVKAWWKSREVSDELEPLGPLIPFVPKRLVRQGTSSLFDFTDLPVSCSSVGEIDPAVGRADGTDAEYSMLRGVDRRTTRRALEQRGGILTVAGGHLLGKMSIMVSSYQPGGQNSKAHLRELVAGTLAEFGITGKID